MTVLKKLSFLLSTDLKITFSVNKRILKAYQEIMINNKGRTLLLIANSSITVFIFVFSTNFN